MLMTKKFTTTQANEDILRIKAISDDIKAYFGDALYDYIINENKSVNADIVLILDNDTQVQYRINFNEVNIWQDAIEGVASLFTGKISEIIIKNSGVSGTILLEIGK